MSNTIDFNKKQAETVRRFAELRKMQRFLNDLFMGDVGARLALKKEADRTK